MTASMKTLLLRTLTILFLLSGCGDGNTISKYFSFPDHTWQRFENPIIELDIDNPGIFYNMWLELDYDLTLAPEELAVTVITSTPSGEIRSRNLNLKPNSPDGKIRLILRKDFAFAEKGICTVEIENRSQHLETKGVKRIGVVVERIK